MGFVGILLRPFGGLFGRKVVAGRWRGEPNMIEFALNWLATLFIPVNPSKTSRN